VSALSFIEWGGGDTLALMLHGVGGGAAAWGDEVSGTGRALGNAGLHAVAIDLPGYGGSSMTEPYDMRSLAAAVEGFIAHTPHERCLLVGHSMGGMVAQELVAREPQLVHGLVLSGTSAAFGKPGGEWQRQFLRDRLGALDAGGGMPALAPALTAGMASPRADAAAVQRCAALMARVPEATYRAALTAIVGFDRRDALDRIAVPALLLVGEDDRNAPPALMQAMAARIRGAEYRCLAGVGHLANMEAPQPFNAALLAFLRRHHFTEDEKDVAHRR
jgi:3-oxoadipate enol-lactonase